MIRGPWTVRTKYLLRPRAIHNTFSLDLPEPSQEGGAAQMLRFSRERRAGAGLEDLTARWTAELHRRARESASRAPRPDGCLVGARASS